MNANGTLGTTAAAKELAGSRYFWIRLVVTPITSATTTAIGRLRSRAATTAAKAAAIITVMPSTERPAVGAMRMPARPASTALAAHTPIETRPGLVPFRLVSASESTSARTLRPTSVKRSTPTPTASTTTRPR